MASADLRDELNCSICLNVYTDPVTLNCGHNFCRVCIGRVLDTQEGSAAYNCPDCRAVFQERPAPQRNTTLYNIAERFLCTQPEQEDTGIFCTYCVDSFVPAVKSCLMCEASLCVKHLRVHSKSEEHLLTEPMKALGMRKCSIHKKVLMYYCRNDATCICVSCGLSEEHRGHQVEPLNEAFKQKMEKLRNNLEKLTIKREETQQRVQSLQDLRMNISIKAAGVTKRVAALFRDIQRQLDDLEERVLSEISRQEEQVSRSFSDLIQQLEIQKDKLSRKIRHIEELRNMTDPLIHLQTDPAESYERDSEDRKDDVITDLDESLISETLHTGLMDILSGVKRGIYVMEDSNILLDINTAANDVHVSGDLKTASWSEINQNRPETPERFEDCKVLSTRGFSSGRHYWEVETNKQGGWRIGVAYISIARKGSPSYIGNNDKSWGLRRDTNQISVRYNGKEVMLHHQTSTGKIRIYLDYEAGQLSFYELGSPTRHLHTFTATFTEALHAVFAVMGNGWVRIQS